VKKTDALLSGIVSGKSAMEDQGFSQLVLEEHAQKLDAEAVSYLRKTKAAAYRMDRLIQDVLSFTRISRQDIQLQPVNLDKLVRDIIDERPELQGPAAEIVIASPLLGVVGHEASLTQCLTNMLENAVKFVAPGVKPRVRVWTEPREDKVRLWIEDNGIGIEEESQKRLFSMFERLHSQTAYEGTGIGLAIVRKAIERMKGEVGLESEPGRGSRFWFELPPAS